MAEPFRPSNEPAASLVAVVEPFVEVSDASEDDNLKSLKGDIFDALSCVNEILGRNETVKRVTVAFDDVEYIIGYAGENKYHLWRRFLGSDGGTQLTTQEQGAEEIQS